MLADLRATARAMTTWITVAMLLVGAPAARADDAADAAARVEALRASGAPDAELAAALVVLARAADADTALAALAEAGGLYRGLDDPIASTDVTALEAVNLFMKGDLEAARRKIELAEAAYRAEARPRWRQLARLLHRYGQRLLDELDDQPAALRPFEAAIVALRHAAAEAPDEPVHTEMLASMFGAVVVALRIGDLDRANALAADARAMMVDRHFPEEVHELWMKADIEIASKQGRWAEAHDRARAAADALEDDGVAVTMYRALIGNSNGRGQYDVARSEAEALVARSRAAFGDPSPQLAEAIRVLGIQVKMLGDVVEAEHLFEASVQAWNLLGDDAAQGTENLPGMSGLRDAPLEALNSLAVLRADQGRLAEAAKGIEELIARLPVDHPDDANFRSNLAMIRWHQDDRQSAVAILEEVLARPRTNAQSPQDRQRVESQLGGYLIDMGEYSRGMALLEAAVRDNELHRDSNRRLCSMLRELSAARRTLGDPEGARSVAERAVEVAQDLHVNDVVRVNTLLELAGVYHALGDDVAALQLGEEVLAATVASHGENHRKTLMMALNVALLRVEAGDESGPAQLEEVAARLAARDDMGDALAHLTLKRVGVALARGAFAEARAHLAELDGLPEQTDGSTRLALTALLTTDPTEAGHLADRVLEIREQELPLMDSRAEREALAMLSRHRQALERWLASEASNEDPAAAWVRVLRLKGRVAARSRAVRAQGAANAYRRLREIAGELTALASAPPAVRELRVATLSEERDELERRVRQRVGAEEAASGVHDPAALCRALPADAVLVDFLEVRRPAPFVEGVPFSEPHHLQAFVLTSDCATRRVDLGPTAPIAEAVDAWRQALSDPGVSPAIEAMRGREVAGRLWAPLAGLVDAREWILVPDGFVTTVPFSALPTGSGGRLVEQHLFTTLDRAGDLLRPSPQASGGLLVVSNVDYGEAPAEGGPRRGLTGCTEGPFVPLPATREEGERVASWWARSKQRRLPVRRLTGEEATEPAVTEAMSQARVLHLATHGYFTDRSCNSALEDEEQAPDPMTLSGLALAAVNRPSEAQQVHDGLLTAADVARLDLGRVGLVVLSACETGLGATRSGQGVLGLRRAFSAAGADALVVSLWSVPDQATRSLMDDFYRFHLRRGVTPPEALRRAQLAQLHEQQRTGTGHPSGWAGFVVVGRSSP